MCVCCSVKDHHLLHCLPCLKKPVLGSVRQVVPPEVPERRDRGGAARDGRAPELGHRHRPGLGVLRRALLAPPLQQRGEPAEPETAEGPAGGQGGELGQRALDHLGAGRRVAGCLVLVRHGRQGQGRGAAAERQARGAGDARVAREAYIVVISYHIIPYHIIVYYIMWYYIISYHIILYHIVLYYITLCYIISYYIIS